MNSLFKTILLATDGSADADMAVRATVDLSQKTGAELHVVHAWHTVPSPHFGSWISGAFEQRAREVVDEQVEKIKAAGGEVSKDYLKKEPPAQAVLGLAAELNADLIVMGSRGLGPVKRLVLGSVSEEVVNRARRPVLLLRGGGEAWPPVRVVVGEDFSEDARRARELAGHLAPLFDAETLLAHVISLPATVPNVELQGADLIGETRRQAEEHLAERAEELERSSGSAPDTRAVVGYPARTLAEIAEEQKQTLLVVGSRGLNFVKRAMLGSVSSNLLRTVERPVLVVPPPADEAAAP